LVIAYQDAWRRGLVWAMAEIGAVAVVFTVGAALPLTRSAFRDSRGRHPLLAQRPAARHFLAKGASWRERRGFLGGGSAGLWPSSRARAINSPAVSPPAQPSVM
jgi:hypothetical protein